MFGNETNKQKVTFFKKVIFLSILFIICAMLFSCSLEPVDYEHENDARYYIYCTLNPVARNQEVLVGKTFPETHPRDISDVVVTISSDIDTAEFTYTRDGIYKDLFDPLEVRCGETYTLNVNLKNGRTFFGHTTVPGEFHILKPAAEDTLDYYAVSRPDTVTYPRIRWSESPGGYFYTVVLHSGNLITATFQLYNTTTFLPEFRAFENSSIREGDIIPATLYVFAHDSSQTLTSPQRYFANYHTDLSFEEFQEAIDRYSDENTPHRVFSKNVTSDIGLFGAVSVDSCRLYLRVYTSHSEGAQR